MEPPVKCAAGCGQNATVKWHDRLLCRECAAEMDALLAAGKAYEAADRHEIWIAFGIGIILAALLLARSILHAG